MNEAPTTPRPMGSLAFLMIGPILWALHLTAAYGGQSALCAFDVGESTGSSLVASGLVIAATLATLAVQVLTLVRPESTYRLLAGAAMPEDQRGFLLSCMRILTGLSILAVFYAGIFTAFLPACAQLR